ncbi:hypothetical protein GGH99_005934, partial [Coemansia sp. RSA 1285]
MHSDATGVEYLKAQGIDDTVAAETAAERETVADEVDDRLSTLIQNVLAQYCTEPVSNSEKVGDSNESSAASAAAVDTRSSGGPRPPASSTKQPPAFRITPVDTLDTTTSVAKRCAIVTVSWRPSVLLSLRHIMRLAQSPAASKASSGKSPFGTAIARLYPLLVQMIGFAVRVRDLEVIGAIQLTTKPSISSTMDNNEKRLFIKDGDDVFIQRNINDSESNNPTDGIRTSVYKHFESNMRVVVCRTSSPVFTLNIYVPTASTNDKGIPHTLEHLVFSGSKRYPKRGYLDTLAAHNYSIGTNAWTSVDHTCYTFAAAAEDAVANVLPVFLDHILNPLLLDEHFVTEVYHYDETGKEKGVVFSEMTLYENNEMARGYYCLNALMYNSSATYMHCNGGRTGDIPKLTIEEIIDYHRKYYDANNVTVVLTGTFSDEFEETYLQAIPADIVQSRGCDSRAFMDCSPRRDGHPRHDSLRFPSSNASSGTINFGWHGPEHQDAETRVALKILIEYLVGTSSGPLNLRFVERSSPLASSVRMSLENSINKTINVWFSGVPYAPQSANNNNDGQQDASKEDIMEDTKGSEETLHLFEERYFENIMASELKRIYDSRFDGDELALEKAAKRMTNLLTTSIEDKQIDFLQRTQLAPDIVASHFSSEPDGKLHIGSLARQFDVIAELAKRPIEYWLALLKKWLIDGTVYSVAMIPDLELGSKLEAERKSNISDEMKRGMAKPDPSSKTATLPHKQNLVVLDKAIGPVTAVQTINADSGFVETQIQIPIGDIPDELRVYLAVFQDVLMDTDLVLPAGVVYDNDKEVLKDEKRIQYSEFASKMADLATLRYSLVGKGLEQISSNALDGFFDSN